jgi:hypothetical protein
LDNEGGIACWGLNSLDRAKVPDNLKNVKWKELSCGGGHTCAIDVNGWPACWGFGKHGQVNSKQLQKHFLNGITDYKRSLTAGSSQANLRQERNSHKAAVSKIRPDIYRACAYMRNR